MKLTSSEFDRIYSTVPRVVVELVIKNNRGILMTKRSISPFKNKWHVPGGTVEIGKSLLKSIQSVAKKELGVQIVKSTFFKIHEYKKPYPHISLVYNVKIKGEIKLNDQASTFAYFKNSPKNMLAAHKAFFTL